MTGGIAAQEGIVVTVEDATKLVPTNLRERAGNALVSSFCASWLLVNWRFVGTLLFGGGDFEARLVRVDGRHMTDDLNAMLAIPLLLAALWTFVLPFPMLWVNAFVARRRREEHVARSTIGRNWEISKEHAQRLRREIYLTQREYGSELHQLRVEVLQHQRQATAERQKLTELEARATAAEQARTETRRELNQLRDEHNNALRKLRSSVDVSAFLTALRERNLTTFMQHLAGSETIAMRAEDGTISTILQQMHLIAHVNGPVFRVTALGKQVAEAARAREAVGE